MAISRFLMGSFTALFGGIDFLVNQSIARGDNSTANVILGMWRLIFDSPHGLLFIMPLLILVPSGILYMWRCERRRVVLTTGLTAALVIVITSLSPIPVTGETVGSRSLLPIIPLLIIPAVFIEQRGSGEKVIFGFLLLLTIYMSSFGWLYGVARGRGFFAGVLQDSHARAVLLARKDDLSMPEFRSAGELREAFFSALKRHDLRLWLTLLSDRSTEEIREIERTIFNMQIRLFENRGAKHDLFFLHTDPDSGITITIPDPTESMDDTVPDSDN
jgi:hypothetical protein